MASSIPSKLGKYDARKSIDANLWEMIVIVSPSLHFKMPCTMRSRTWIKEMHPANETFHHEQNWSSSDRLHVKPAIRPTITLNSCVFGSNRNSRMPGDNFAFGKLSTCHNDRWPFYQRPACRRLYYYGSCKKHIATTSTHQHSSLPCVHV